MSQRSPRFRYPLQVVLDKQAWDVATIASELAAARSALQQHEDELARLRRAADGINQSLAAMRSPGGTLDLDRQRLLLDYRGAQDEAIDALQARVQAARGLCEQIGEQLARARQALNGFENHSERLQRTHLSEATRMAAKESDDAWLLRRTWQEANS